MAKLFGFSIDENKKSKSIVSPVPQTNEDGVDNYIASGFYGQYLDIEGVFRTENDLIRRYREMALHPECDAAIEDVVNAIEYCFKDVLSSNSSLSDSDNSVNSRAFTNIFLKDSSRGP